LRPILREDLCEIAFAVEQRHRNHRRVQVGRRTNRVPSKHTQSTAVTGHAVLQRNLHGEIRDRSLGRVHCPGRLRSGETSPEAKTLFRESSIFGKSNPHSKAACRTCCGKAYGTVTRLSASSATRMARSISPRTAAKTTGFTT